MSHDESSSQNVARPTFSEGYLLTASRLMQGLAVFLALVFIALCAVSLPDILKQPNAGLESLKFLGFGLLWLGFCVAFWTVGGWVHRKTARQLADPDRSP
ncbi:hypothetical protein [Caulobacter mirabilis]|uniref:Uncharacterized protein n=1 Tax=Caulobacter mirabilis TaxID=69666 RepID=A0A2D2ATV3_9CAUL|nr:hypothetical protein [Caulobacter mirabilis]ATQ41442.1 hypothetical protein CSW64_02925 [Caulobacter mirabilis]